uniref:Transposase n=1 Tax=Loa loa TaxID=7209 RepID=A0A1I7VFL3_LOALO
MLAEAVAQQRVRKGRESVPIPKDGRRKGTIVWSWGDWGRGRHVAQETGWRIDLLRDGCDKALGE